jgi:hypothetical protein
MTTSTTKTLAQKNQALFPLRVGACPNPLNTLYFQHEIRPTTMAN